MKCSGCQTEIKDYEGVTLTRSDGSKRGPFCVSCRQWVARGHRDVPVVFIGSKIQKGGTTRTRYYRNDTTGQWYSLSRDIGAPDEPYFVAYGPAATKAELMEISKPLQLRCHDRWGGDFSWAKAERVLFKTIGATP